MPSADRQETQPPSSGSPSLAESVSPCASRQHSPNSRNRHHRRSGKSGADTLGASETPAYPTTPFVVSLSTCNQGGGSKQTLDWKSPEGTTGRSGSSRQKTGLTRFSSSGQSTSAVSSFPVSEKVYSNRSSSATSPSRGHNVESASFTSTVSAPVSAKPSHRSHVKPSLPSPSARTPGVSSDSKREGQAKPTSPNHLKKVSSSPSARSTSPSQPTRVSPHPASTPAPLPPSQQLSPQPAPASPNCRRLAANARGSASQRHRDVMGGCVSKNGVQPSLVDASSLPASGHQLVSPTTKLREDALQLPSISPSTRPTEGGSNHSSPADDSGSHTLQNRDRRRLSLSQSDPAARVDDNDADRGQFFINQQAGNHSPINLAGLDKEQLQRLAEVAASRDAAVTSDDDDDTGSLPSSDEEAARLQAESGKSHLLLPESHVDTRASSHTRECRRLSVSGMPSSMRQDNFENKRQEVKSDTGFFDANTLLALGIGYACKKGLKPESPNQDDFFIVRIDDWGLYGVFDGHGPYGHDVSNFVQRELPKLIYNDANFLTNPKEALRVSFITVHQMLEGAAATHNLFDCSLSGSTATVVLHRMTAGKLYIAHVGDSRCVMGRLSKNGKKIEAVDLTTDHKPNTEAEKKRIVASGGQVRRLEGDIPYRVFLKGRLYPGLAMSRAIGDTVGTQAGVICEPDVTEYSINAERDLFITLCSDGVWEFLSSTEVAEAIHANGVRGVQLSSDLVARESWNRWIQEEGNVVDDITTEVIYLNPEHPVHQAIKK